MNSNNNSNSDTTSNDNSQNNNQQDNGKQDSKSFDTGETTNQNGTIFGSLFAAFGSLLLFRRRNKKNEDK